MNSPPTSIWDWKTVGKLGKLAKLGDGWKCDYWWTKLPWNHHPNRREHVQNSIIIITLTVTSSMFAHSWEMFEWKEGRSILKWSKSPVESWNKHVRSFQSGPAARSRQLSIKDNIHDILRRMLISSHQEIASKRPLTICSVLTSTRIFRQLLLKNNHYTTTVTTISHYTTTITIICHYTKTIATINILSTKASWIGISHKFTIQRKYNVLELYLTCLMFTNNGKTPEKQILITGKYLYVE